LLKKIAKIINLGDREFARLKKQFKPNSISKKLMVSYDVLGVAYDASIEEIKARWKQLIIIYHPDKLVNATEKEMKIATKRMAEINLAYKEIVKAKGKK
jgi:DnaJ like chaperone protein